MTENASTTDYATMQVILNLSEDDIYKLVEDLDSDDVPEEYRWDGVDEREKKLHEYAADLVKPVVRDLLDVLAIRFDRYFICEYDCNEWVIYTCTTDELAAKMREIIATDNLLLPKTVSVTKPDPYFDLSYYSWEREEIVIYDNIPCDSLYDLKLVDEDRKLRPTFTPEGSSESYDTAAFIPVLVDTIRDAIGELGYESNPDLEGHFELGKDDPIGTLSFLGCPAAVEDVQNFLADNADDIVSEAMEAFRDTLTAQTEK